MNQHGSENEILSNDNPPFPADLELRSRISEILLTVSDHEICGEILEIIDSLKRSEERYRQIVETQADPVCRFRVGGIITFVNPAACRMAGMQAEDLVGLNINDFFSADHRDQARALTADMTPKDPDRTIETRIVVNGRGFWLQSSVHGFFNSSGELIEFQVVSRDITESKQAQDVVRESENRFRLLADAMPQLVWTATPEGQVDYYNRRHEQFSCLVQNASGFWEWTGGIHPEDLQATMEFFIRAVETEEAVHVEHRIQDRNGIYHWYLTRGVPVHDEQGRLAKWIGTTTDINDLKEAEKILQERTRELETANKELETFSYSVSHDLRAPLRAIEGFSRMLMDKGRVLDEETKRLISTIRANTRKMDQLIYDLLGFSRSGRVPLSSTNIEMEKLLKDLWQEQITANPDRRMELKMEGLPGAFGDRALIRQAVSNLLANAVKFSKNMTSALIEIGVRSEGRENTYFIRDNGAGFDMKYYDRLFGVFQRLHAESEYEGTGVGLAIVQRIISRHGGRVWAEGEVGKGATFFFSLPSQKTI